MKDVKFWRYYIPSIDGIEGWGVFLLDSTGMFAAVTDYGNAAYKWDHSGEADFRNFFAKGISGGYLLKKLFYDIKEYDHDETLKNVKEDILSSRLEGGLSRETAREEWDLLEQYDGLYNEADFTRWYDETNLRDAGEHFTLGYPASARAFVNKLMPRFCEVVAAELQAERERTEGTETTEQAQAV